MTKRPSGRGQEYLVTNSFPESGPKDLALTENMYRDYSTDTDCIESFPGYRKLTSLGEKIYGIYPERRGDSEHYLVHAGGTLYRCSFADEFLDSMTSQVLCDMAHHESSSYRHGDSVYIFDSEDITVIGANGAAKKVSENEGLIYVPTTFKDGLEYEQLNLLTPTFREEYYVESVEDLAYESQGLLYKITSDSKGTCAVIGSYVNINGRLDIPARKFINGKYYRVTEVAPFAFYNKTGITSVCMGPYVEKIGNEAFYGCTSIQWVMTGERILEIGSYAFCRCTSMTRIYLGANCKFILENAFLSCDSLTTVYYYGTSYDIGYIEGLQAITHCMIYYKSKFSDKIAAIPIFTPTDEILDFKVEGVSKSYTAECSRGILKIRYSNVGDLEGNHITIMGNADTAVHINSKRRTPYANIFDGQADGIDAIYSSYKSAEFDGRYHLFGSSLVGNVIFSSSYTKEGITHPLYFGALDYTALGSSDSEVSSMSPLGNRLAIVKRSEGYRGKIYIVRPEGEEFSLYGRRFSVKHTYDGADLYSDGFAFGGALIYLSGKGVMRLDTKSDISPGTIENLSEDFTSELDPITIRGAVFAELSGYLAILGGGELLLGDKRQSYKSDGGDTQFRWYRITDVQSHVGESPVYYYAHTAPTGFYVHPEEGKPAEGQVISYKDEEGVTHYYVQIGIRRYAVVPGDELFDGEAAYVSAVCEKEMSLIFGTEAGELFAFNTDKRGVPPREIYESEDFDPDEYRAAFGRVIHPYHYSAAHHRIRYAVKTRSTDGGLPYLEKSTKRGSLSIRLERRSTATVKVVSITDSDRVTEASVFPLGGLDFSDMDFGEIAMTTQSAETHMLPEKERNWVEKQIVIYTDGYLAPFAIQSLSYIFKTKGKIKNR